MHLYPGENSRTCAFSAGLKLRAMGRQIWYNFFSRASSYCASRTRPEVKSCARKTFCSDSATIFAKLRGTANYATSVILPSFLSRSFVRPVRLLAGHRFLTQRTQEPSSYSQNAHKSQGHNFSWGVKRLCGKTLNWGHESLRKCATTLVESTANLAEAWHNLSVVRLVFPRKSALIAKKRPVERHT